MPLYTSIKILFFTALDRFWFITSNLCRILKHKEWLCEACFEEGERGTDCWLPTNFFINSKRWSMLPKWDWQSRFVMKSCTLDCILPYIELWFLPLQDSLNNTRPFTPAVEYLNSPLLPFPDRLILLRIYSSSSSSSSFTSNAPSAGAWLPQAKRRECTNQIVSFGTYAR